jgi:hypothetical protein
MVYWRGSELQNGNSGQTMEMFLKQRKKLPGAMHHVKTLLATAVVVLLLAVVLATAQDSPGGSKAASAIEVTDDHGSKHVVTDYGNGSRFFGAGLPFDQNITDDYQKNGKGFWERAAELKTAIAVELHTPDEQTKIRNLNLSRGVTRKYDVDQTHAVLLIPLSSLEAITFTQQKIGEDIRTQSVIRLAGGEPFDGGGGFGGLKGKESLGSLGIADFSLDFTHIRAIRSLGPPVPFVGDFGFFDATEVPFAAKVTDTAGEVTVLTKALYCTTRQFTAPNNQDTAFVTYGDVLLSTVAFKSSLDVTVGGTSTLSIPPSKLRTITLNLRGGWYDATATLRTGENVGLTIDHHGVPNGIVGASSKGWVWIPWLAVASVEFEDKDGFSYSGPVVESKTSRTNQAEPWTDPETGLMWTGADNGVDVNWNEASSYCTSLRLAGHSNWRLPGIDELEKIYSPRQYNHIKGEISLSSSWWYWSGTQRGPGEAWFFPFRTGNRNSFPLDHRGVVRALCVRRSGDSTPSEAVTPKLSALAEPAPKPATAGP